MIKEGGVKVGIVLNPGTFFETVKEVWSICDYVMIMSANPEFTVPKYLDFVIRSLNYPGNINQLILIK